MNNKIIIVGKISSDFIYSHTNNGEDFFVVMINTERTSGTTDSIPIMVSNKLITDELKYGVVATVVAQFRSYSINGEYKLYAFANDIYLTDSNDANDVELEGCIINKPLKRHTKSGRCLATIMLSVKRNYGKCDMIPCICWGRNASYISKMGVGSNIKINGRLQSRMYNKNGIDKTTYEVSVCTLDNI